MLLVDPTVLSLLSTWYMLNEVLLGHPIVVCKQGSAGLLPCCSHRQHRRNRGKCDLSVADQLLPIGFSSSSEP